MGGIKDSTHLDVKKTLSRRFSPGEGWQYTGSAAGSVQPEYVLSRRISGRTERVLVNVNMAPVVHAGAVKALQAAANAGKADKAVLVVPGGADVAGIPAGIDVLEMNNWQVVNGRIAWSRNIERSAVLEEERAKRGIA